MRYDNILKKSSLFRRVMAPAACLVLLIGATGICGQDGFHNTADEMIRELTREPQKYRTILPKTRTIVVMEKKNNTVGMTQVVVDNSMDIPKVRAKVHFDFDSARVRPTSYDFLREVAIALNSPRISDKPVMINGHADSDGAQNYNLGLSLNRAASVKYFLVNYCNVHPERLLVRGYGETLPLVSEMDETSKQMNRRVEFELVR